MKFLADHCVYGGTVKLLREQGHEVITLKELGRAAIPDSQVLVEAQARDAVLITTDKGFGNILVHPPGSHGGIILLRMRPTNQRRVHEILLEFLRAYDREALRKTLVVIDTHTYRIRRDKGSTQAYHTKE